MNDQELERRAIRKAIIRLLPLLGLLYFVAYLDRSSISFAKLTMGESLGISEAAFGLASGAFFIGYALVEIPSNLVLARVGARRWIARIAVTWGIVAMGMAFVTGSTSLTIMRVLLGIAEAGFFPGVVLYLTFWFPLRYRLIVMAGFTMAGSLSSAFGAPLSGWLLGFSILGLEGWQVLFIVGGVPAVLLGIVTWFVLPDRPDEARWLSPPEREWLTRTLAAEVEETENRHGRATLLEAFRDARVWSLTGVFFGVVFGAYGLALWLPTIVKELAQSSNLQTGFLVMLPHLAAAALVLPAVMLARRLRDVRWLLFFALVTVGGSLLLSVVFKSHPVLSLTLISVGVVATATAAATFWNLPGMFLTGVAAAGGIALINSLGNLGGFAGPYAIGWVAETHGVLWGLVLITAVTWSAAVGLMLIRLAKTVPVSDSTLESTTRKDAAGG